MIAATAATFGPWLGFAYAAAGAIASAIAAYGVGVLIGRRALENVLGPRINRVRRSVTRHGVIPVASVRIVPIAPFTIINLAAGASRIPFMDYLSKPASRMFPGLVVMSALKDHQIFNVLTAPDAAECQPVHRGDCRLGSPRRRSASRRSSRRTAGDGERERA